METLGKGFIILNKTNKHKKGNWLIHFHCSTRVVYCDRVIL